MEEVNKWHSQNVYKTQPMWGFGGAKFPLNTIIPMGERERLTFGVSRIRICF
jgi:hypothetical protein